MSKQREWGEKGASRKSSWRIRVSGFGFQVPNFGFLFSGFGSRVSGSGFQVPSFGFQVSDFGSGVSGFGFRGSDPIVLQSHTHHIACLDLSRNYSSWLRAVQGD